MKYLLLVTLMGCGSWTPGSTDHSLDCVDGCTPEENYNVPELIEGPTGPEGPQGSSGLPGSNGGVGPAGAQGAAGPTGEAGNAGTDGATGPAGSTGADGYSIVTSVSSIAEFDYICPAGGTRFQIARDLNRNSVWDVLDDHQQLANICDGLEGPEGPAGQDAPPTPFTTVGIVDPCGDAAGVYDEVFIRMANGQLLASFSENVNGKNTRFSLITAGTYLTTDGSGCIFSVDGSGGLYNEHY